MQPTLLPDPAACPGRFWVAYSGGVDSHVLLHLAAAHPALSGRLRVVHCDHGLHADSAAWAAHCAAVCAGLGVPLTTRRLALSPGRGESPEAVARAARYAAFAELLQPGDWLATAHHQDDQAETLLLALLRGSGVHGLAAMPRRAPLGAGELVRPLLDQTRATLLAYAGAHDLHWLEDPSNADTRHDRNLLRARVLPLLRGRWPAADATLARAAAHCAEAAGLIDALADGLLPGLAGAGPGTLSVRGLLALPDEQGRAVVRRWLALAGHRPPATDRLRRVFTELLPARADRAPLVAWAGCELRRHRDDLFALTPLPPPPPPGPWSWTGAGAFHLPGGLGELLWVGATDGAGTLAGEPGPDVQVGFARAGLGGSRVRGSPRSLTGVFQANHIPPWLRGHVPLLFQGGELLGPVGIPCPQAPPVVWRGHPWTHLGLFR